MEPEPFTERVARVKHRLKDRRPKGHVFIGGAGRRVRFYNRQGKIMGTFEEVDSKISGLQYMSREKAEYMREFISTKNLSNLLEIGFFKGKSTAYFASILEDLGRGHITTVDRKGALRLTPNINDVIELVGLRHRVTPVFADRSHTWELSKMIRQAPRPQFDFCYFDGGHTWDVTGFGFVLVNMLLKPGGWIIFDDLDWTIQKSVKSNPTRSKSYQEYGDDEKSAAGVRLVFETLVNEFEYRNVHEVSAFSWGVAQKPLA